MWAKPPIAKLLWPCVCKNNYIINIERTENFQAKIKRDTMSITSFTATWTPTITNSFYSLTVTAVNIHLCFLQCVQHSDCGGIVWTVSRQWSNNAATFLKFFIYRKMLPMCETFATVDLNNFQPYPNLTFVLRSSVYKKSEWNQVIFFAFSYFTLF